MKLTKLSVAILGCASMAAGMANAAGPTLSDIFTNSGITESGYIDAGYTYQNNLNANNHFDSASFLSSPGTDSGYSSFDLKQAGLTLAKQPASGFGGLVNVTAGSNADIIKSYPYTAAAGSGDGFDLTQAFVQYASGANTVQAGKYTTLASNEVIAPTGNTNITRSIEFYSVPFTHTGVRDTYAVSNNFSLIGGVNNGWDQQQDANRNKTLELGFNLNPSSMVSWSGVVYYGDEPVQGGTTNAERTLVDTVLTIKPTSALSLILNADYGQQKNALADGGSASWNAIVGYVNYQWTDKWRTSFRLETFDDKNSVVLLTDSLSGTGNKRVSEATFTVGYAPEASFELRGEVRDDKASKDVFLATDGTGHNNSLTAAVEALYKF